MSIRHHYRKPFLRPMLALSAVLQLSVLGPLSTPAFADAQAGAALPYPAVPTDPSPAGAISTNTPIKHVIMIVGENRSFDHVFATYVPTQGQTVQNLLSEKVVNLDGTPGPNYSQAEQYQARDWMSDGFQLSPLNQRPDLKVLYPYLPAPQGGGANPGTFSSLSDVSQTDPVLDSEAQEDLLNSSGVKVPKGDDTRIYYAGHDVDHLPPGPFQWTNSQPGYGLAYTDYIADQTHSFYQEWQENDCNAGHATQANPSGCRGDLFAWVEQTAGSQAGGRALGFYNMATGDVPYFKSLADQYTISDNYHQAMMGATGPNHLYLAYADTINISDANGNPITNGDGNLVKIFTDADPTSQDGKNNSYSYSGSGATVTCSNDAEPGVNQIAMYLGRLNPSIKKNCRDDYQYLILQVNPAYTPAGVNQNPTYQPNKMVPVHQRSLAQALEEKNVPWTFYADQWDLQVKAGTFIATNGAKYCPSCDPYLYSSYVMESQKRRNTVLKDETQFAADVANNTLPAVSYIKPSGMIDGHPGNSTLALYEGAVKYVVDTLQSNPALAQDTAILITVDEGGGFYDSGYIQPLDFFGDGARLPMIVVSPYSQGGRVSHVYNDHASFVKFVEYNWGLQPLTHHSRDNLPNPTPGPTPYVPGNSPAIGDLTDLFVFPPPPTAATN